ncbi:VirB3 family type IV secretion system protein [Solidesulfovibrio alcoholivorans]|uniref:type IV secretion system protein VirB3 n=1 Tax=Solidesulfovibrio alcoholivorans TaxID=81406 RepID=UPI0009FE1608
MDSYHIQPFPLFKGATRVPTVFGVPSMALLGAFTVVALIAMWVNIWCWLLLLPVITIMRLITKHDDRAFSIWWLWFETKCRNKNTAFWGGSTYSPTNYKKYRRR